MITLLCSSRDDMHLFHWLFTLYIYFSSVSCSKLSFLQCNDSFALCHTTLITLVALDCMACWGRWSARRVFLRARLQRGRLQRRDPTTTNTFGVRASLWLCQYSRSQQQDAAGFSVSPLLQLCNERARRASDLVGEYGKSNQISGRFTREAFGT